MNKLPIILIVAVAALGAIAAVTNTVTFKENAPQGFEYDYTSLMPLRVYQVNVGGGVTNYTFVREFSTNEIRLKTVNATNNTYVIMFEKGFAYGNYNYAATVAPPGFESDYNDPFPFQVRPEKPGNWRRFQ
jgi:hypothetical protein